MAQGDAALDLILFAREKKWSLVIPPTKGTTTCAAGSAVNAANRLRVVRIQGSTKTKGDLVEDNWEHLMGEVNGTRYRVGLAARPELEYHLVGVGAKSLIKKEEEVIVELQEKGGKKGKKGKKGAAASAKGKGAASPASTKKGAGPVKKGGKRGKNAVEEEEPEIEVPTDQTDGRGIEVLFDPVKFTYILNDDVEDRLLLLFRNDPKAALRVDAAYLKYFDLKVNTMDHLRSRLWRRYVRFHLQHKIWDEARFEELCKRFDEAKVKAEAANKILDASQLEESSTDSEDEEAKLVDTSLAASSATEDSNKGKKKEKKARPSSRK